VLRHDTKLAHWAGGFSLPNLSVNSYTAGAEGSNSLRATVRPASILPPADRIELVSKIICAPRIGRYLGAAWKKCVSPCRHANVHERSLNFQIRRRKRYWSFWMDSTRCLKCESVRTFV